MWQDWRTTHTQWCRTARAPPNSQGRKRNRAFNISTIGWLDILTRLNFEDDSNYDDEEEEKSRSRIWRKDWPDIDQIAWWAPPRGALNVKFSSNGLRCTQFSGFSCCIVNSLNRITSKQCNWTQLKVLVSALEEVFFSGAKPPNWEQSSDPGDPQEGWLSEHGGEQRNSV